MPSQDDMFFADAHEHKIFEWRNWWKTYRIPFRDFKDIIEEAAEDPLESAKFKMLFIMEIGDARSHKRALKKINKFLKRKRAVDPIRFDNAYLVR
jgi:hypothetical protein